MTRLTDLQIDRAEAAGFRRWTKAGKDRLYINATELGLEVAYYKTGNISSAKWCGERISNADARRLLGSKVYVDVATGELHVATDFGNYDMPTLEERAAEALRGIGNDQNAISCTVTTFSCSDPTIRDEEVEEYQSMGEAKERFDGIAGDLAKRYLPDTAVELAVNGEATELAATHTDPRGNLWTIHSDGSIYWADDFAYYERSLRGIFNCIDFWACQWAATDRN